jgi:hypothetical protein
LAPQKRQETFVSSKDTSPAAFAGNPRPIVRPVLDRARDGYSLRIAIDCHQPSLGIQPLEDPASVTTAPERPAPERRGPERAAPPAPPPPSPAIANRAPEGRVDEHAR